MADNIQKTLDIRVNYSEALNGVAKYRVELENAKREAKAMTDALKEYEKALDNGTMTEEEYNKKVLATTKSLAANKQEQAQLSDAIRTSEKVIKNQITQQNLEETSIKALRAQLSNLTKEYDELSASQRDNEEVGGKLLASINETTDQIKKAEEATQRYQRNVGNYKSALEGMEKATDGAKNSILGFVSGGNPLVQMLINTSQQLGSVKQAFALAGQGAVMLGKQFLALMANPIVAFLALLAAAFMALKNGIQSSEERMNQFRIIMAPLQKVLDTVSVAIGKVCGHLLNLIGLASDAIMWLNKMAESLPVLGKYFEESNKTTQEYIDIEKQKQEITKASRDEIVKSAEREREISDLRAKLAEKDKYTNEERLKFLDQAIAKEKEQAEANKRLAQMKLENLEREAALADNDAAMNDKLAEAKAAVIRADTELSNKMRELNAQRVEAINGINAEAAAEKKAAEEKAKAWREAQKRKEEEQKQALNTEEQLWREYEDALLDLIKDSYEKQKQVVATQYQREIEDLKKRLEEEKNLTASARDAINNLIIAKQQEMNQQIAEIDKAATDEQIQKDAEMLQRKAEVERMSMENRLNAVQEGSLLFLELSRQQADKEHELRQQEIDQELLLEQNRIENLVASEEEKNALLELAQQKHNQQSIANDQARADASKQIAMAEAQMKVNAYNSVKSGIDAMAQHSKAFAIMSKTIALAEIAINTGKAIATGIAQAMAVPFPGNLIAIATTIGTVMANIATAISTVKSAKFAKGGRVDTRQYASGGDVRGAGTGTSDSIHAMLSNGESVMTAAATSMYAPVLSAMNQSAGGNPITGGGSAQGEDMLARAVARGLMAMPNPVVSVEEINTTARRVQVLENLASV
jgi:hypothetical protein